MKRTNVILNIIIVILFIAELISRWHEGSTIEYAVKPWLMVWIITYFFVNSRNHKNAFPIFLAFFFSWVGDMFLMVAKSVEILFYAGVGGFFIAQLTYIKVFLSAGTNPQNGLLFTKPLWTIPFIIYLLIILCLITGDMHGFMLPIIIIYSISLISMSLAAINRKGLVNNRSFIVLFIGSLLFVMSDSMIAINKFFYSFPKASFLIMLTYFPAQYLIMKGLIDEDKQS